MKKSHVLFLLALVLVGCSTPKSLEPPETYSGEDRFGSMMTFKGLAYPKATVKLYIDGSLLSSAEADKHGEFLFEAEAPGKGEHVVTFAQSHKGVSSEIGEGRTIVIDLTPPDGNIEVNEQIPSFTSEGTLHITGKAEPNSVIIINEADEYLVNAEGHFTASYDLISGKNSITIGVEDDVGNRAGESLRYEVVNDESAPTFMQTSFCMNSATSVNPLLNSTSLVETVCLQSGKFFGPWEGSASAPITGSVSGNVASIKIDGKSIDWREDGDVNQRISLYMRQGTNNYDVEIVDKAGNIGYGTLSISWGDTTDPYDSDYSDLEDSVEDLESRLEDLE